MLEHFQQSVDIDVHTILSVGTYARMCSFVQSPWQAYVTRHSFVTVEEKGLPHELTLPGALLYQLLADTVALKNQRLLHMVCVVEQFHIQSYIRTILHTCL